jgi:hypothetical protein
LQRLWQIRYWFGVVEVLHQEIEQNLVVLIAESGKETLIVD